MPSTEENCPDIVVTDYDIQNSVKTIPKIKTLVRIISQHFGVFLQFTIKESCVLKFVVFTVLSYTVQKSDSAFMTPLQGCVFSHGGALLDVSIIETNIKHLLFLKYLIYNNQ